MSVNAYSHRAKRSLRNVQDDVIREMHNHYLERYGNAEAARRRTLSALFILGWHADEAEQAVKEVLGMLTY